MASIDPDGFILTEVDAPPFQVVNPNGGASFLLIGDHAGDAVPARLAKLGLTDADLARHIGWDIGIAALGEGLAARLDTAFVRQTYSRLVVDCNRGADAHDAIPEVSDATRVPGNADLSQEGRRLRFAQVHEPYHRAIAEALVARPDAVLVALHSFTPVMAGVARPWHCGVLHDRGRTDFAMRVLDRLRARGDLIVGDNEPYAMDGIDYTVPRHAYPDRAYVELEIRQDLLGHKAGVARWVELLGEVLAVAR